MSKSCVICGKQIPEDEAQRVVDELWPKVKDDDRKCDLVTDQLYGHMLKDDAPAAVFDWENPNIPEEYLIGDALVNCWDCFSTALKAIE